MRFALTLAYHGAGYAGWQRQDNARTVQAVAEGALAAVAGAAVSLVGASRTDAGVHARGQIAHLDLPGEIALGALVHGTNHRLPADVRVLAARSVTDDFHARFSARGKEYRYRLLALPVLSPFEAPFALRVEDGLDGAAMAAAAERLVGTHDFAAFALAGGAHRSSVRTVTAAEWIADGPSLTFRIRGDGFLRGMVRSVVGTLLEVGRGRRSAEEVARLCDGGARADAGPTAPAHGLMLERVFYDEA